MYINFVRSTIWFCLLVSTIHINYAMQTPMPEDPQEGSLLCQLPQDILYLIAENLEAIEKAEAVNCRPVSGWKFINTLGCACKTLDRRITIPGKPINVRFPYVIYGKEADAEYLSLCLHAIKRYAGRDGYNPISVDFYRGPISYYMPAVLQFFESCAESPISEKIKALKLEGCKLTALPPAITKLQELEDLDLSSNTIGNCTQQITLLHKLRKLDLSNTKLEKIDPSIITLQSLKILKLDGNKLGNEALPLLTQLRNLEQLWLFYTGITNLAVAQSFKNWPTPLSIAIPSFKDIDAKTNQVLTELEDTTSVRFFIPD